MNNIVFMSAAFVIATALSGCNHKPLGEEIVPTQRIRVEFDWQDAPEANPEGMCVYFYNSDTGEHRRFDFPGSVGGIVSLPYGDWHVLTYNNDMPGVLIRGHEDFLSHTAYTRDGNVLEEALGNGLPPSSRKAAAQDAPRVKGTETEAVVITPDMMWGQSCMNISVRPEKGKDEIIVTMRPHELTCTYTYEIRNVENLEHVTNMCGALSGMAGELTVCDESLSEAPVTLPIPAWEKDRTTITGQFYSFGHHPDGEAEHHMTLYVWMDDGTKLAYGTERGQKWNVTQQIDEAPDKRHVLYIIDGLDLPVEMTGSGIAPSTDNWSSEHHDIEM